MTRDTAVNAGRELLRSALVAKLAVDLNDPQLAERAARYAAAQAQLLVGLDWSVPKHVDDEPDELPQVDDPLDVLYPTALTGDEEDAPPLPTPSTTHSRGASRCTDR